MRKFDAGRSTSLFGPTLGATDGDELHVACWLAAVGYTPEGVVRLMEDRGSRLGHQRRSGPSWADSAAMWLAIGRWVVFGRRTHPSPGSRYCSAVKKLKPSGMPKLKPDDLGEYLSVVGAVHGATLSGRTAETDRAVLRTICEKAYKGQTVRPGVDIRTIKERAHIGSSDTVTKSLDRLELSGCIVRFSGDTAEACRYLLRAPAETGTVVMVRPLYVGLDNYCSSFDRVVAPAEHPAFHSSALGKQRRRLLAALAGCHPPSTNVDWYKSAGLNERQFYRLLRRLDGRDGTPPTVRKDVDGWHLADDLPACLDLVAEHHGTDEKCRQRAEAHKRQRQNYREQYLVRRLPDRYQLHGPQNLVDTLTGELVPFGRLVTPLGGLLPEAGETQPAEVASSLRDLRPNCEACGHPTDQIEPTSGLPWHRSCRMPHSYARRHRDRGLTIPDHLVKYPTTPPNFDPYDLYPCDAAVSAA